MQLLFRVNIAVEGEQIELDLYMIRKQHLGLTRVVRRLGREASTGTHRTFLFNVNIPGLLHVQNAGTNTYNRSSTYVERERYPRLPSATNRFTVFCLSVCVSLCS